MKIKGFLMLGYENVDPIEGFVEWSYPVLPGIGDMVNSPFLFIPTEKIEEFKKIL
jgi:hypothetical protein